MRDFQVSKVYSWERKIVAPKDNSSVAYKDIQGIVDYVWRNEGYQYPPRVKPLAKQEKTALAKACRNTISAHEDRSIPTWVILHEMAHSLTAIIDGRSNLHGEDFMGMYIKLLVKYLHLDICVLMYTCGLDGIKYNLSVKPYFLEENLGEDD